MLDLEWHLCDVQLGICEPGLTCAPGSGSTHGIVENCAFGVGCSDAGGP